MVNMQGNFYSAQGVPLSPNNYYNYMALLNDASAPQNATFGMNDYQLSGHLSSAGGSQGQYGWQQNQEFNVQSEELPSLPGNQDGLSALGFCEFPGDKHQKEHIQSNLMQYQQMAVSYNS
ncbi:putative NOT transcription complex subunit VIP2 [Forsythia ovata]|uniref:NOT transcription complex subunit VIP2 n=1 Tax=Forsythia ovata TaxID=205694 RepID=A0ABD1W1W0_9LAMI